MNKDTLQIYYDSVISQDNQGDFLFEMFDYIEWVIDNEECRNIIMGIQKEKEMLLKEKINGKDAINKKIRIVKDEYRDIIENSRTFQDNVPNDVLDDSPAEVKVFFKYLRTEIERKITDGQGMTIWDAWEKICLAYFLVHKKEWVLTRIEQQDRYDKLILKSMPDTVSRMKELEQYCLKKYSRCVFYPPEMLKKEDYKPYLTKVHNYLLEKSKASEQVKVLKSDLTNTKAEQLKKPDDDIVFTMTYNPKYRKIFINGCQVRKFNESENSRVFEDAYNNQNTVREIKSSRRAQDFVNAFGFNKNARNLFFPISAGKRLMLNNPVRKKDLAELGLVNFTLDKLLADIRENAGDWSGG